MGSEFSKDKEIGIFMDVDKPYYVAGDQVSGTAYIEAKANRPYVALQIKLTGKQHVQWKVRRNKKTITYKNDYRNYDNSFTIYNFKGFVQLGQYSFPFSFLLPQAMSGSFTHSEDCYIRYTLSAMLTASSSDDTQMYKMPLNIMEPPRFKVGPTKNTKQVNSKCCGCCMDYGTTGVTLSLSKNFLRTGQQFNISGVIDNTRGTETITGTTIVLEERIKMISSRGRIKQFKGEYNLLSVKKLVKGKMSENFAGQARIPTEIKGYTAIGRIVARYYVVTVSTEYGCCAETAQTTEHVILHNTNPALVPKKMVPKPNPWHPQQYALVVCNSLKPFVNQPNNQIHFRNLPGNNDATVVGNQQPNQNMMMMYNEPTMMELQADMNDMNNNFTNNQFQNNNFGGENYNYNPNQPMNMGNNGYMGNEYGGYPQGMNNNMNNGYMNTQNEPQNQYPNIKSQNMAPIEMNNIELSPQNQNYNNSPYDYPNMNHNNNIQGIQPRFNTDMTDEQRNLPRH